MFSVYNVFGNVHETFLYDQQMNIYAACDPQSGWKYQIYVYFVQGSGFM